MALVGKTWLMPFIPYLQRLPFGMPWKMIWNLAESQIPPVGEIDSFASLGCLTGKTVIVTGANVGLGEAASLHFARFRPKLLIMACRSVSKGRLAQQKIFSNLHQEGIPAFDGSDPSTIPSSKMDQDDGVDIRVWELDLADFSSIKRFAARWKEEYDGSLDVLVENAAVVNNQYEESVDRHETMIQVNDLSVALLPLLLLPYLRMAPSPRLVIVSSDVHAMFKQPFPSITPSIYENLDSPSGWLTPFHRYPMTKYLELVLAYRLHDLPAFDLPKSNGGGNGNNSKKEKILIAVVNPGLCNSSLSRNSDSRLVAIQKFLLARPTEMGSRNLVHGAVAREVEERGREIGVTYWGKYKPDRLNPLLSSKDPTVVQWHDQFWKETVDILVGVEPSLGEILRS